MWVTFFNKKGRLLYTLHLCHILPGIATDKDKGVKSSFLTQLPGLFQNITHPNFPASCFGNRLCKITYLEIEGLKIPAIKGGGSSLRQCFAAGEQTGQILNYE
jgi:hypothetical protein